jgi:AmiR/NasT family two-component response regulator
VLVYDQKISISERKIFLEMAAKTFPALALVVLVDYLNTVEFVKAINKELVFKYVLKPYQPEVLKNIIDSVYGIAVITKLTAAFQEELNLVKKELIQFKNTRSY